MTLRKGREASPKLREHFGVQTEPLEKGHSRSWARKTSWAGGARGLQEPRLWAFGRNTEGKAVTHGRWPFLQVYRKQPLMSSFQVLEIPRASATISLSAFQ